MDDNVYSSHTVKIPHICTAHPQRYLFDSVLFEIMGASYDELIPYLAAINAIMLSFHFQLLYVYTVVVNKRSLTLPH